jgi:hypothetical protein
MATPADPVHPVRPDLTWHLRRLLEAVKGAACGLEGGWRWLGAPMALLTWICTRRERREAAATMQAVQGLVEAFLGLLEDFRAGRLVAENAPQEDPPPRPSPAVRERGRTALTLRWLAPHPPIGSRPVARLAWRSEGSTGLAARMVRLLTPHTGRPGRGLGAGSLL